MIRVVIGLGMASAAMLGATGCSPAASGTLPALSSTARKANAPVIAELVDRLCVDGVTKSESFPQRLRQIAWPHRQIQHADPGTTLDVWKLPHIELVHAATPIEAPQAHIWTCMVAVDAQAAPSAADLEAALRRKAHRGLHDSRDGDWRWKPSPLTDAHITINPTMTGGQSIFVEFADLKPLNALFGS